MNKWLPKIIKRPDGKYEVTYYEVADTTDGSLRRRKVVANSRQDSALLQALKVGSAVEDPNLKSKDAMDDEFYKEEARRSAEVNQRKAKIDEDALTPSERRINDPNQEYDDQGYPLERYPSQDYDKNGERIPGSYSKKRVDLQIEDSVPTIKTGRGSATYLNDLAAIVNQQTKKYADQRKLDWEHLKPDVLIKDFKTPESEELDDLLSKTQMGKGGILDLVQKMRTQYPTRDLRALEKYGALRSISRNPQPAAPEKNSILDLGKQQVSPESLTRLFLTGNRGKGVVSDESNAPKKAIKKLGLSIPQGATIQQIEDAKTVHPKQYIGEVKDEPYPTFRIVPMNGDWDASGMRSNGRHMANTPSSEYGAEGTLGNPIRANDTKGGEGLPSRDEAIDKFENFFNTKIERDPAFKKYIQSLRNKRVGYYKPELPNHLQIIQKYLATHPDEDIKPKTVQQTATDIKTPTPITPNEIRFNNRENREFSNFTPSSVPIKDKFGNEYPTVENYYQAMKTTDPELRKRFVNLSPGDAKYLGRSIKIRPDWNDIKDDVMRAGIVQKFKDPLFMQKLKATKGGIPVEWNTWHDTYWGKDAATGEGKNMLGQVLAEVRDGKAKLPAMKPEIIEQTSPSGFVKREVTKLITPKVPELPTEESLPHEAELPKAPQEMPKETSLPTEPELPTEEEYPRRPPTEFPPEASKEIRLAGPERLKPNDETSAKILLTAGALAAGVAYLKRDAIKKKFKEIFDPVRPEEEVKIRNMASYNPQIPVRVYRDYLRQNAAL